MSVWQSVSKRLLRLAREDEALAVSEYAVMLSLIVIVAMAAINGIGSRMMNLYTTINAAIPE